ncbi:MAG: MFS transporter [Gammaproteobacteria bacterium]
MSLTPESQESLAYAHPAGVSVEAAHTARGWIASFVPWLMCSVGALFYFYEYLLRVAPSVMTHELMLAYNISATALGNLAAYYYYIYTPMQLVVGVSMDRFGPRRLFTVAGVACALGSYLFAATPHLWVAQIGRFLVGFGSAFAFVGVMKLATIWLPPQKFALVSGLTTTLGTVGGIVGNLLLTKWVAAHGWRSTSFITVIAGLVLTVFMFLTLRDGGKYQHRLDVSHQESSFKSVFIGLFKIIRNPQIWVTGAIGCMMYIPTSAFAELWGNPYLQEVHHFSPQAAAQAISMIFLGWAIGGPLMGWLSDRIYQRRLPMTIGSAFAALLLAVVLYVPGVSAHAIYVIFFVFGFFSSAQVIVFAVGREISPLRSAGTAIALTNMFVMIGGVLFQPLIGKVLDMFWSGQMANGVRLYSSSNFQLALSILPLGLLLTVVISFFLRETHCRVLNDDLTK